MKKPKDKPVNLFNKIYDFYQINFDNLTSKKFHFASRLYLYNNDGFYHQQLLAMKPVFLEKNFLLREYTPRQEALAKFDKTRLNHINKFPNFLHWHDILIQGLYAQTVYGENHLAEVKKLVQAKDLLALESKLFADRQALAWLATYAISFLFFLHRWFLEDEDNLDLDQLIEIGLSHFDEQQPYELNLQIYYFTHCIIGETLFYARPIPEKHLSSHLKMLKIVEKLIKNNYFHTSLDHKLEFLMCCQLCHYQSDLEQEIFAEADRSVAPQGEFVVDKFNYYQATKGQFDLYQAEHQNVLYLMACQKYSPHALV